MAVNRDLNVDLAIRKIRIGNGHRNRTINILTRSDDDLAVLVNLYRNVVTVLVLSGDLGVIVRVVDLDTSILRILGRINGLHIDINGGLLSFFPDLERSLTAGDNTALGLRVARLVLDRVTVLVENRNLQSLIAHHDGDVDGLAGLLIVRGEGHNTSCRINLDLVCSNAFRQLA